MTKRTSTVRPSVVLPHRPVSRALAVTGVAYSLSWIVGLSLGAPSPKLNASGAEIVRQISGHRGAVAAQFALTEGAPALGLALIALALARSARRDGATVAAACASTAGVTAAVISLAQFVLGVILARTTAPGSAAFLYQAVNRADGLKMFALAVLAGAGAAAGIRYRWLRGVAAALAAAIASSGVAYLLLLPDLAALAYPAGVLLLIFVTSTGFALDTARRPGILPVSGAHDGVIQGPAGEAAGAGRTAEPRK